MLSRTFCKFLISTLILSSLQLTSCRHRSGKISHVANKHRHHGYIRPKPTKKSHVEPSENLENQENCCPKTLNNLTVYSPLYTELYRARLEGIWRLIHSKSPLSIPNFGDKLLDYYDNSDSLAFRTLIGYSTTLTFPLISNQVRSPCICAAAKFLNASIKYEITQTKCERVIKALHSYVNVLNPICKLFSYDYLCSLDCELSTKPPNFSDECFNKGLSFDLDTILQLFGRRLPCEIKSSIRQLYNSDLYSDRAFVTIFSTLLVDLFNEIMAKSDLAADLDMMAFVIDNDGSSYCCGPRRKRLKEICRVKNATNTNNAEIVINHKFNDD